MLKLIKHTSNSRHLLFSYKSKFWKKHWFAVLFFLLLLLAAGLRFYQLGQVPHGMTWDEAAIGYNGYAIFKTRRDEWLVRLPISFQSFGDYKAPLAIYLNGLFTAAFGMNLWAVRLPFALASLGAIWGMVLMVRELWLLTEKTKAAHGVISAKVAGLVAGLILTFSPWHFHFSRAGFESGMALFLVLWGVWLLFNFIRRGKLLPLIGSVLLLSASVYTYHSAKVVVPLLVLITLIAYWRSFWQKKISSLLAFILGNALLIPFYQDSFTGQGLQRMGVTVFGKLQGLELLATISGNYLQHLNLPFLLFGQTTTLRHGDGQLGVLMPTTLILILITLIYLIFSFRKEVKENKFRLSLIFYGLLWLAVGILPAAMAVEVPHSNRALLALPAFVLLAMVGLDLVVEWANNSKWNQQIKGSHGEKGIFSKAVIGLLISVHSLLFINYLNHYYLVFDPVSAEDFKDGYIEAFSLAEEYEKGLNGKPTVDKIVFTSDYGQPYIYALFVRKTNPIWYRGGSLVKYEFKEDVNVGDLERANTLVVGSNQDELLVERADHLIFGSDGQPRFKFYLTE